MPAQNFSNIVDNMRAQYDLRIQRWRTNMSGCAWRVVHDDGRVENCIEAPFPKTPISLSIFLHEVGHHAIGFETYRKRCEEEYHVWLWAIDKMRELRIEPDARVLRRFQLSMQYAVGKAMRRGVKKLPEQLEQFLPQAA
ncbi:MAG: hypothetical protein H7Z14_10295 [Anaerolineae bacterium]|nr:hypothetical protein [Phycisphaerae bacterium]